MQQQSSTQQGPGCSSDSYTAYTQKQWITECFANCRHACSMAGAQTAPVGDGVEQSPALLEQVHASLHAAAHVAAVHQRIPVREHGLRLGRKL